MKNVKLLFSILFFFISNSVLGQMNTSGLTYSNRHYYYQNHLYKKHDLHMVMVNDPAAYDKYEEYERTRAVCDFTGYSTLVLIGGGLLLIVLDDGYSDSSIIGAIAIGGSIITGTVALVSLGISNNQLKDSVNLFNENLKHPPTGSLSPQLDFGISQNGVGLVLRF